MKKMMIAAMILTALFAWACSGNDPVSPPPDDNDPGDTVIVDPGDTSDVTEKPFVVELRLVSLARSGQYGSDMTVVAGSQDSTVSEIAFDSIASTTTLSYVLVNSGTVDLYDVSLTADSLAVWPSEIGLLEASSGTVTSLPLLEVTLPHVVPPSGVGALLPMHLGAFVDTLRLGFTYDDTSGSPVDVEYLYPVSGTRMGGRLDVYSADGKNLGALWTRGEETGPRIGQPFSFTTFVVPVDSMVWDSLRFVNTGNVAFPLHVYDNVLDSLIVQADLQPGAELYASPVMWLGSKFYYWAGPTEYLVEWFNGVETDGIVAVSIAQSG